MENIPVTRGGYVLFFYPNEMTLTENDFRFSKIKMFTKKPEYDNDQIVIRPLKGDKTYYPLSPMTHKCYIKHNIKVIDNEAPTLEQFWQELKVFRDEVSNELKPLIEREPIPKFFEDVNNNFASSQNVRRRKKKGKPLYYYHINEETGKIEHLDYKSARKIYCKKYEETTLTKNSESLRLFQYLLSLCKNRDKTKPVIIRGYDVINALDAPTNIEERYNDLSSPFGHEYCLVEMLMHYPNLNECIWNRDPNKKHAQNL